MVAHETVRTGVDLEGLVEGWGGKLLMLHFDAPTGAWIIIAIHATRANRAAGGTRMMSYSSLQAAIEDALRLSSGMTLKFGAVGMPWGGAKTVIAMPAGLDGEVRKDLLRRYGTIIHQLGGLFYTGPDIGTTSDDMTILAATAAPYVFARPREAGGTGDPGPSTALGVFHSISTVAEEVFGSSSLEGKRVLVQGAGDVGAPLIALLHGAGAHILVSDVDDARVRRMQAEFDAEPVPVEAVYDTRCDIFAPCAVGGVLNSQAIGRLHCKAVAGSANNQLRTMEDAERLRQHDILYAPDFICNAGGILAAVGVEAMGWTREDAERQITTAIPQTLRDIFASAKSQGKTTEEVAEHIAATRSPVDAA